MDPLAEKKNYRKKYITRFAMITICTAWWYILYKVE